MKTGGIKLVALATLVGCAVMAMLFLGNSSDAENELTSTGRGSVENLLATYKEWEATYVKNGADRNLVLPIGPFKGLSTESSNAHGRVILNLIDGTVSVEVKSLPKGESWDVWLVENRAGSSVMPEPGDIMVRVGDLKQKGGMAKLEAKLGTEAFAKFEPDLVTVTRAGKNPAEDRLLVGTTTLFHRLYRTGKRGQFGNLSDGDEPAREASKRGLWNWLVATVSPTAHAQIGPIPNPTTALELLITAGRQSFFTDTFNGNGRTCGTCHRENKNLTIDPEFIATLPPNDPLFVAETQPALACNDPTNFTGCNFENPQLMRKFGLICENVDGFNQPCVFRGVPHTLALLQNTLTPVADGSDGTTIPPNERTGWGGDGAPTGVVIGTEVSSGRLRDFIIGAVIQHYPKRQLRQVGADFTLPTVGQLDALEAFLRSTGRRQDLDLSSLSLKSEVAARGQLIFNNPGQPGFPGFPAINGVGEGKCFFCHLNAGASDFFFPGQNANFNTNIEGLPGQPARLVDPSIPRDGGFGRTGVSPTGGIGNGTFNTPVLVEAADTGPFFHNNSISTIEGTVAFYNSDAFNNPLGPGFGALIGGINLQPTEIEAVAAFLRVINALENIRSSDNLDNRAKQAITNSSQAKELINLSISEVEDAIKVLRGAGLHPKTVLKLEQVLTFYDSALTVPGQKNALLNEALALKVAAVADLKN